MNKELTIVVPLYNKAKYIEECLYSIYLSDTNVNYECIVVDDDSTDGSSEIAKNFCMTYSNFTYIHCLRNHGYYPSYARNIGIRMCETKYITFFDADDVLCENYHRTGIDFMNNNNDYSLYFEHCATVSSPADNGIYTFSHFFVCCPTKDDDLKFYINNGGGLCTRSILRTDIAKRNKFKERLLEDSIFMIDYLYDSKGMKYKLSNDGDYSFLYMLYRSDQDVYANGELAKNNISEREYIIEYVKEAYPQYYKEKYLSE